MKTHYFEFSQELVDAGYVPSTLCYKVGTLTYTMKIMKMANRIYYVDGNMAYEVKNRNRELGRHSVSDEDKVVLKLKAVLL